MHVCFLLKNIRINFRFRFCLQVHDSRCALVLFTDFTLKLCNSYVVIAVNVLSSNFKALYIVVKLTEQRGTKGCRPFVLKSNTSLLAASESNTFANSFLLELDRYIKRKPIGIRANAHTLLEIDDF